MTWTDPTGPTDPTDSTDSTGPAGSRWIDPTDPGRLDTDPAADPAADPGDAGSATSRGLWRGAAFRTASALASGGYTRDLRLLKAVGSTPLYLLAADQDGPPDPLDPPGLGGLGVGVSGLVWMLGLLGRRAGPVRALLVGADAYAAAVWCADLGASQVVVTDADPARAETTRDTLRALGHAPQIIPAALPDDLPDGLLGAGADRGGPGRFDAVLVSRAAGGPGGQGRRELIAAAAPWQRVLAPGGRLVAGPVQRPARPRQVRFHQRTPAGGWTSWITDPYPLGPTEQLALAHLVQHPDLAEQQRARHVADEHGNCAGCAGRAGHGEQDNAGRQPGQEPVRAPCPARQLADLAHAAAASLVPVLLARPLQTRPPEPGAQN